ncbi:hypothetical protein [Tissierella sp.]|uniref:hypothetical protein n=1 Tax=Tissierella sp. TaxID=41274 RepID=UPI003066AD8F
MALELRWIEGVTTVREFVKALTTTITLGQDSSYWELVYPSSISAVTNKSIVSTKPFSLNNEGQPTGKDTEFYLMIERPVIGEEGELALNYVELTIGDKLNESSDGFAEEHYGESARYAWYRDFKDIEGLYYGEWLPIKYFMNIDIKTFNLVIQGDPSIDVRPYHNALFSYANVGAIESYEGGDEDIRGNFGLTVGSDIAPKRSMRFGANTGTGVLDVIMAYSRAGAPYQAHDIKFKADNPYKDKYFIGPSEWTHKFHFDEITVIHKYDRERGKLRNVLIGDRSALENNAELIYMKGTDEETVYKSYQISAPYTAIEESANPLYGVILRKS